MPIVLRVGTWPPALGHLCSWEALMHRTITIAKANFTTIEFSQKSSTFLYLPSVLQLESYPSPLVSKQIKTS